MKLVIDNTSTAGTFFDNIHNTNMLVNEYDIENVEDIKNFKDLIDKSSKVYIKEDQIDDYDLTLYDINNELYSTTKYNYINENNVDQFRISYYDKIFETINESFILSKETYNSWLWFLNSHIDCRIDKKTGKHKFGTIGGGAELSFDINYCSEEMFPKFNFSKATCLSCKKTSKLSKKKEQYDDLDKRYEYHKKYGYKLNLVEFYRFIEIYNEYKSTLTVSFMGTGLGDCISVKVKDYVFDITDCSHW